MFVCPPQQVEQKCGWVDLKIKKLQFFKVAFRGHFSGNNTELYVRNTEWNEKRCLLLSELSHTTAAGR